MAAGKKTGGRQKGVPNKRTRERMALVAQATSQGISPLEVMLGAMRDFWERGDKPAAANIAKDAAPYLHPRLASHQMTLDDKREPGQFTDAELEAIAAASRAGVASQAEGEEGPNQVH